MAPTASPRPGCGRQRRDRQRHRWHRWSRRRRRRRWRRRRHHRGRRRRRRRRHRRRQFVRPVGLQRRRLRRRRWRRRRCRRSRLRYRRRRIRRRRRRQRRGRRDLRRRPGRLRRRRRRRVAPRPAWRHRRLRRRQRRQPAPGPGHDRRFRQRRRLRGRRRRRRRRLRRRDLRPRRRQADHQHHLDERGQRKRRRRRRRPSPRTSPARMDRAPAAACSSRASAPSPSTRTAGEVATVADSIVDEQGLIATGYTPPLGYDAGAVGIWKGRRRVPWSCPAPTPIRARPRCMPGRLQVDGSIAYSMTTRSRTAQRSAAMARPATSSVEAGGMLGAGNSVGLLTTGDVTLQAGALFEVEIGGTTAGSAATTRSRRSGRSSLGNATLEPVAALGLLARLRRQLRRSSTTMAPTRSRAPSPALPRGRVRGARAAPSRSTYQGGDGNDVVLTAIQAVITGTPATTSSTAPTRSSANSPPPTATTNQRQGGNDLLYGIDGNDVIYGNGRQGRALRRRRQRHHLRRQGPGQALWRFRSDDTLDGGKGKNKLTGGGDADTFVFSTAQEGQIRQDQDFGDGNDVINLSQDIFKKLGPVGELSGSQFTVGERQRATTPRSSTRRTRACFSTTRTARRAAATCSSPRSTRERRFTTTTSSWSE